MYHTNNTVYGSISFPVWCVIQFASIFIFSFMNLVLKSVRLCCCIRSRAALAIACKKMPFIFVLFKWILLLTADKVQKEETLTVSLYYCINMIVHYLFSSHLSSSCSD